VRQAGPPKAGRLAATRGPSPFDNEVARRAGDGCEGEKLLDVRGGFGPSWSGSFHACGVVRAQPEMAVPPKRAVSVRLGHGSPMRAGSREHSQKWLCHHAPMALRRKMRPFLPSINLSMRLEGFPGLQQRLQAGKNAWPSIGAGSVRGVIVGPLVVRHRYFGGFGLGQQFDHCA